ncbi:hypothetical protein EG327_008535 [Venturia inaequalis]|uniref:Mediator of RNA polymerase II transcription subunit 4 n=1 Tax=Venturia inaequalis TaxID=5025 RepID=A0A8H3UTT1_VENIN|nr:hypothetical protein EG327_008535 [Venturia inaequalis]
MPNRPPRSVTPVETTSSTQAAPTTTTSRFPIPSALPTTTISTPPPTTGVPPTPTDSLDPFSFRSAFICPSTCGAEMDPLRKSGVLMSCTYTGGAQGVVWNIPGDCELLQELGQTSIRVECTTSTADRTDLSFTSGQVTGPVPTTCSVITDENNGWPIIGCPPTTVSQTGNKCDMVPASGRFAGVYVTVTCAQATRKYRALSGSPLPLYTYLLRTALASSGLSIATPYLSFVVPPANPAPTGSTPIATATQGSGTGGSAPGTNNLNLAKTIVPVIAGLLGFFILCCHQANHARILKLRQTTESLDNQIKSTVTNLAEIRKELLAIPSAAEPDTPTRDVPFDELLAFAKNIAKFTLPPNHHLKPPKTEEPVIEHIAEASADISMTNGASLQSPTQPQPSPVQPQSEDKNGESKTDPDGRAFSKLTQEQRAFLDDVQTMPFMPWPDFDLINAGILRQVDMILSQGIDPATVMTAAEQAANEENLQRQRDELDAAERKRHQEWRAQQAQQAQQKPKEPEKEFNAFAMFEDDEEMED